jgi:twitching motility protein PilT
VSNANARTGGPEPVERLGTWLDSCVRREGSDLHLTPGLPPHMRVEGELRPIPGEAVLQPADLEAMGEHLLNCRGQWQASKPQKLLKVRGRVAGSIDGAFTAADGTRFRFNYFKRQGNWALALRRLEDRFRTLKELGLPEGLYGLCDQRDGLVVVSGPTGAGKSTTLATMIDRINRSRHCHIVTIEDPIEYLHKPERAVVNQRQIGLDAPSFNRALVAAMRQDPDVILVGEIRDRKTIRTAITAAETGHLVFTTLHAGDSVSSIERLAGVFPAAEQDGIRRQLSLVLRAIIAQHLLPCTKLREDGLAGEPDVRRRLPASEILIVTPAVANLIATGKSAQIYSSLESGRSHGMQTLEQDLARLWASGLIEERAAIAMARNPSVVRDRFNMLRTPGSARFQNTGVQA